MSYSGGSCDRKAFFSEIARGAAGLGLAAAVAPSVAVAKEVRRSWWCSSCCCLVAVLKLLVGLPLGSLLLLLLLLLLFPPHCWCFFVGDNKPFGSRSGLPPWVRQRRMSYFTQQSCPKRSSHTPFENASRYLSCKMVVLRALHAAAVEPGADPDMHFLGVPKPESPPPTRNCGSRTPRQRPPRFGFYPLTRSKWWQHKRRTGSR